MYSNFRYWPTWAFFARGNFYLSPVASTRCRSSAYDCRKAYVLLMYVHDTFYIPTYLILVQRGPIRTLPYTSTAVVIASLGRQRLFATSTKTTV